MNRQILPGLKGVNPLGFLASVGLLRLCNGKSETARLGFLDDGSFRVFVEGFDDDLAKLVFEDAQSTGSQPAWLLKYDKEEKKGTKKVADLKAAPADFQKFLRYAVAMWSEVAPGRAAERWAEGRGEPAAYAASFGTSVAVDNKGNTKPTAFHFTAANQQFLGAVMSSRELVSSEWAQKSLFEGNAARPGSNLRWDPSAERNWALMAENPVEEGTSVDAPLEWLAFRALPVFPTYPVGKRVSTTAVAGRGNDMDFTWPLWSEPASLATVRSLVQLDWEKQADRATRGIFALCTSSIRRTSQGVGNFGPAEVVP